MPRSVHVIFPQRAQRAGLHMSTPRVGLPEIHNTPEGILIGDRKTADLDNCAHAPPNGGYRAEIVTGSVPGSRRWMSTLSHLDLESYG